ncbi:MAG: ABC transporter substrate-binding protein [Clostridia bacterium]|nr:ABC transporter substrate-binding protein [Clostridia bacterium]MDE7329377.1 ABC transporter substrate-binding protein [Clostridia bacterium]
MKKTISIVLCIALIAVACAGILCGCSTNDENTIKLIEVTHSVFYAPLYVAIDGGYFEEEGIKIDLSNGGGADKCMTSLISGQSDIGLMGPEAAIYIYNEGRSDYPVIFAQLTKKDGSFLMAKAPDDNFSWASIAGKEVIGGRVGGVPAMALEYAIKKAGLTDGVDYTINYDVQYDLIGAAFEGGTGDFCTMFEPAASAMQSAGIGYKVASVGEQAGNMPYTAFMATQSYMSKNPEKMEKFTRALIKAMEFVNTHSASEIAEVLAPSFVGTDVATLANAIQAYKDIDAYCSTPIMDEADFDLLQSIIVDAGVMTKKADFSKLFDATLANSILNN